MRIKDYNVWIGEYHFVSKIKKKNQKTSVHTENIFLLHDLAHKMNSFK